jgi:ABC-type multidrug transport system fused ATPase/permease subunit
MSHGRTSPLLDRAPDRPTPRETYADRIESLTARHNALQGRWSLLGNIRLALIVVAAVAVWQWWGDRAGVWGWIALAAVAVYLVLVVVQRGVREQRDRSGRLVTVGERALARLERRWDDVPMPPDAGVGREHPHAWDLNILGRASVVQRIGTPVTRYGWDALHAALLDDRDLHDLGARQQAVEELSWNLDLRHAVEASGLRTDEDVPDPDILVRWASGDAWLRKRPWLRIASWLGPVALLVLALLWAFGILPAVWMIAPILFNTAVFTLFAGPAASRVQGIVPLRDAIAGYRDIFGTIASARPSAQRLVEIDRALEGEAEGAMPRMAVLSRLVSLAIPPGAMLYFPLQMALMWDVHVLELLEGWQSRSGRHVRGWLQASGEWEALAALSVLRYDDPGWAFPRIDDDARSLRATDLAHPLLPPDEAVPNDVKVGPVGQFLFVTGSNMSGKSTLLRAIGVNAVLAQAGAPVAASSLTMPPLRVSSLMRVEDSLERGVSFFMAELERLKAVVDRVEEDAPRMALYLLDEILQGTNTGERQVASRQVLRSLSKAHAIGAISSHDLELIGGTDLDDVAVPVHFAEVFERDGDTPRMTFGYRLRPGLATSSNALALMEMLGFELEQS